MATRHKSSSSRLRFAARIIAQSACQPMPGESIHPVLAHSGETAITFIGHSSFLLQIGGRNLLIDPVFARRLILLRRLRHPGVAIESLPPIDMVLLSHAHMDHLNRPSLRRIVRHTRRLTGRAPIAVVPWGVEDLVSTLGFRSVIALEWWHHRHIEGLDVTLTPAKHWGARTFHDTHRGYGGYVIRHGDRSIYHSGDTAYFRGFQEIRKRLAPEIALLPIGAYNPDSFRSVHTSPEDALQAFIDLGAGTMIPMHYGTFRLSQEPVEEPVQRLLAAARHAGLGDRIRVLSEGETAVYAPRSAPESSAQAAEPATT